MLISAIILKGADIADKMREMLEKEFSISHTTIQIECKTCEGNVCGAAAHAQQKRGK